MLDIEREFFIFLNEVIDDHLVHRKFDYEKIASWLAENIVVGMENVFRKRELTSEEEREKQNKFYEVLKNKI